MERPLTVSEAAASLGLAASTVRRQIADGAMKAERLGPIWVITPDEVERYRRVSLGRYGRSRCAG